jgi:molybdopterin-synthase adenylyltransferase
VNRLIIQELAEAEIRSHLQSSAPLEEGAFCLLRSGRGNRGLRLLADDVILPNEDSWEVQTRHQLRPSAQWLSSVISRSIEAQAGLLFIHSHPDAHHPAELSEVDFSAVDSLARTLGPMLDGPFAAAVVHETGWAGALWQENEIRVIERIAVTGMAYRLLSSTPDTDVDEIDLRQIDALGEVHDVVRHLSIGVAGCGGLGSPIAEQLVRMGVAEVILIDDDLLDTPSNVRRVFGSKPADLDLPRPLPKVDIVGRHLDALGFSGTVVRRVRGDVRVERVFRELLDADVVLVGTDTHGSRAATNELVATYLMPVIDVGVRVGARAGKLAALVAGVHLLTPSRPCLWCRSAIDSDVIRAENMPAEERERLEKEGYVVGGVGEPAPSVVALTVLGSGLATCALLGLLSHEADVMPAGYVFDGLLGDAYEERVQQPKQDCRCRAQLAKGDASAPSFIGEGTNA